jgi:DNA/RNA-binding domain of Phe-tRNA-synthetase-like protein
MWFVLESLGTMPEDALEEAGDMLVEGLWRLIPDCEVQRQRVS